MINPLREQWPWNPAYLRMFLFAPALATIALTVIYYPVAGIQAGWFLTGIAIGVVLRLVYGAAGKRVAALIEEHRGDAGEMAEGLLVIGKIQSPGIVILGESTLELIPIVGDHVSLGLEEIRIFRYGRMLPGKYLWGKRAFILEPVNDQRLAFAVAESTGRRWSRRFKNGTYT